MPVHEPSPCALRLSTARSSFIARRSAAPRSVFTPLPKPRKRASREGAVIAGTARLKGGGVVAVTGKDGKALADVEARHIIVATGARARTLPGLEPDGKLVWTYKEAMIPDATPKTLLVVGSGAIGIEFASFYNALGAKTTVVEILDRILPVEDEEVSAFARKAFEKQGMTIHTGAKVEKLAKAANSVKATLTLKDGKQQKAEFDRVILAVGIAGNVENSASKNWA